MHSSSNLQARRSNLQPDISVKTSTSLPSQRLTPIFAQKAVERCHVILPDTPEPASAIRYEEQYYVYVKFFPTLEVAHQKAALLTQRGHTVLMTRIPKGLVLWALELESQPVQKVRKV